MRRLLPAPLLALAAVAAVLLAACGEAADEEITGVCPPVVPPSLRIEVVDAAGGANLSAGASGTWTSGEASGVFYPPGFPSAGDLVAYGPTGRYSVVVQHPGYRPWSRDDLVVPPVVNCMAPGLRVRAELVAQ